MLVNMKDMLENARLDGYAVGFFDTVNVEMARAVIEEAEALHAPVIVGTAEILLPKMGLDRVADFLLPMAAEANVPVAVHYDHGLTFNKCMEALNFGYSSIMYDCSTASYEENLANVAEMVKICHAMDVTVEGELGHVGDNEGKGKLAKPEDYYTDLDMAVAVGNAHGDYKFPPKLDFDRITEIAQKTGVPLVLHGGSGLSDSDFQEAARRGVCKVNIFTDIDREGKTGIEKGLKEGARFLSELIPYEIEAMKAVVREKIILFGSVDKA